MTTIPIKLVAFIVLLVHGIGHFQGVAAGLGIKINNKNPSVSWLLKSLGVQTNKYICLTMFLIAGVVGILTAFSFRGIFSAENRWQSLALITAIFSTLCLVIFPNGFAMFFNKIGAIVVNFIIFYSIAFGQHWPSVLFED